MTFTDMYNNVRGGKYDVNVSYKDNRDEYQRVEKEKLNLFYDDLINTVMEEYGRHILYGKRLNESIAKKIYELAWEDGHAYGFYDVVTHASKYASFVYDCINLL